MNWLNEMKETVAKNVAKTIAARERQEWIKSHSPIGWVDDIGKPLAFYEVRTGPMDAESARMMDPGVNTGRRLSIVEVVPEVGDYARYHHDGLVRWSGSGWVEVPYSPA